MCPGIIFPHFLSKRSTKLMWMAKWHCGENVLERGEHLALSEVKG